MSQARPSPNPDPAGPSRWPATDPTMTINYNRGMSERGVFVTPELATGLVRRHLDPEATVTAVRKLYGGSINRVLEWVLDREPGTVVAKVNDRQSGGQFLSERGALEYFRSRTELPVPTPLACIVDDAEFDGAVLVMTKVPGTTLEAAKLSPRGRQHFEQQLATHIAQLHRHTGERFGPAGADGVDEHYDTWLDLYRPIVEREAHGARGMLGSGSRDVVDHVAKHLEHWLQRRPRPALIHGDLWANNILLDDAHPDRPRINAYIDGHASFGDREYELAYLRLFKTAGPAFFEVYQRTHRLDAGFERRARVYWLVTMLQHCRLFGGQYVERCEQVARELRKMR